jgi:hypothetical protein
MIVFSPWRSGNQDGGLFQARALPCTLAIIGSGYPTRIETGQHLDCQSDSSDRVVSPAW